MIKKIIILVSLFANLNLYASDSDIEQQAILAEKTQHFEKYFEEKKSPQENQVPWQAEIQLYFDLNLRVFNARNPSVLYNLLDIYNGRSWASKILMNAIINEYIETYKENLELLYPDDSAQLQAYKNTIQERAFNIGLTFKATKSCHPLSIFNSAVEGAIKTTEAKILYGFSGLLLDTLLFAPKILVYACTVEIEALEKASTKEQKRITSEIEEKVPQYFRLNSMLLLLLEQL